MIIMSPQFNLNLPLYKISPAPMWTRMALESFSKVVFSPIKGVNIRVNTTSESTRNDVFTPEVSLDPMRNRV